MAAHPLLLAGHEGLEAWGHAKAQLVNEGGLILAMDLHFDARFEGRLVYGNEGCMGGEGASDSLIPGHPPPAFLRVSTAHTAGVGVSTAILAHPRLLG